MKTLVKIAAVAVVAVASLMSTSCSKSYRGDVDLKNDVDSISYALGTFMGSQLKQITSNFPLTNVDSTALVKVFTSGKIHDEYVTMIKDQLLGDDELNEDAFKYGFTHQYVLGRAKLDETTANLVCQLRAQARRKAFEEAKAAKAAQALEEGKAFLAENAKKEGVITLASGVQYKVINTGAGASPKVGDRVQCHYEGRLLDGTVFDSSYARNNPATFNVDGVIKGWTEVLQMMKPGDKWTVYIPAEHAYGERGAGEKIGGNETLIFDIELLEIVK